MYLLHKLPQLNKLYWKVTQWVSLIYIPTGSSSSYLRAWRAAKAGLLSISSCVGVLVIKAGTFSNSYHRKNKTLRCKDFSAKLTSTLNVQYYTSLDKSCLINSSFCQRHSLGNFKMEIILFCNVWILVSLYTGSLLNYLCVFLCFLCSCVPDLNI